MWFVIDFIFITRLGLTHMPVDAVKLLRSYLTELSLL